MKYEAIETYSSMFEVKKMCEILGLKSQNYYRWRLRRNKSEERRQQEIKDIKLIKKVFVDSDRIYGYRMIQKQLMQEGYEISEYRVRRIMRENGFYSETQRKYKPAYKGKVNEKYSKNLINQNFRTKRKNEVWVGDITYIKTVIGWVYLAVVIDLFQYIELFYNRKRMHSLLGYMSPVEYRIKYDGKEVD